MIDQPYLPHGGREVLLKVAGGRSPWEGWDAGHAARTPEGQEAYAVRARAITACRDRGLLTQENLLTEAGRAVALALREAAHG